MFNKDSFCEHTAGGVHIYLYGYVSLLAPECVVCHIVWVFVCVISNQTKLKKVELAIYGDLYKIGG